MLSNVQFQEQQKAFTESLAEFEKCIDTPLVPGELHRWVRDLSAAFDRLSSRMTRQRDQVHSEEFREIGSEDPGLLRRVEQMSAEDDAIAALQERFANRIDTLKADVEQSGADEAALQEQLDRFVLDALSFVARVRKQEVTTRTWFVEAFTGDRGTVD